jgi:hypothetical protein
MENKLSAIVNLLSKFTRLLRGALLIINPADKVNRKQAVF